MAKVDMVGEVLPPKFEAAGRRHYSPRVTFQVKSLSPQQRENLRSVLFIVRLLEARVRLAGSIRKASKLLGVSKSFLAEVLRGEKPPGFALARQVGYIPKVFYMRVLEDPEDEAVVAADPNLVPSVRGVIEDRQNIRLWDVVARERKYEVENPKLPQRVTNHEE